MLHRSQLDELPVSTEVNLLGQVQAARLEHPGRLVVVDSDMASTQNLADCPIACGSDAAEINWLLRQPDVGYLCSGARWLSATQAASVAGSIGRALRDVALPDNADLTVAMRDDNIGTDSIPAAVTVLREALGDRVWGTLVVPTSLEPGNVVITLNSVTYRKNGAYYQPEASGRASGPGGEAFTAIDITALRVEGSNEVGRRLAALPQGANCVVDAITTHDLEIVAASISKARALGATWLIRSSHSVVPALVGRSRSRQHKPGLKRGASGGIAVIGPDIGLAPQDRDALLELGSMSLVPVDLDRLLDAREAVAEVAALTNATSEALQIGHTAVVYVPEEETRARKLNSAQLGRVVSRLGRCVIDVGTRPSYVVTHGGVTTREVVIEALNARRNMVHGPILPGLSAWRMGRSALQPGAILVALASDRRPGELVECVDLLEQARRAVTA